MGGQEYGVHVLLPTIKNEVHMLTRMVLQVRERIISVFLGEEGQGDAGFGLFLLPLALLVILILTVVGKQVNNVFSNVSNGLAQ